MSTLIFSTNLESTEENAQPDTAYVHVSKTFVDSKGDVTVPDMLAAMETSGVLDFWLDPAEDGYEDDNT